MAQYKVPQDVEAEDKLLGPFTFRQFVYLLIAAGLIAMAVGLFQLFPLLAIIPILPALLFLVLALPLKKDQPMETYLAAIVSYYLKPRKRTWVSGQRESTILITAPKIVEDVRTRDISQEEATHRLSFLADIVDTGGYAIKGANNNSMREDLIAEANATTDMFDAYPAGRIERQMNEEQNALHAEVIKGMREAIERTEGLTSLNAASTNVTFPSGMNGAPSTVVMPEVKMPSVAPQHEAVKKAQVDSAEKSSTKPPKASIIELANNPDFSVATIAKEANRIKRKEDGEVYISLH